MLKGKPGFVNAVGLGRGSAIKLAENGTNVVVCDINPEQGLQTVNLIRQNGGVAEFFECDVSKEEQIRELVKFTVDTFGKLDVAPLAETDTVGFYVVMKVNVYGMYYALKAEVHKMLKNSISSMINTTSAVGIKAAMNMVAYTTLKFAVVGMTRAVALDILFGFKYKAPKFKILKEYQYLVK